MKKLTVLLSALIILTGVACPVWAGAKKQFVNIGTASIGGSYYPTGGYICNVLNKSRKKLGHSIRCSVESTGGSVANLRSIQSGDLSVGIAMSAYQIQSYNGTGRFEKDGANKKVRFLFGIVEEPVHIVARKELNLKGFMDLEGKVVNTGAPGSGTEAMVYSMLKRYGKEAGTFFKQETKLTTREQAVALCDDKIDAFIWVTAVGAATITEASNTCKVALVPFSDDVVNRMLAKRPEAAAMVIPTGAYRGMDHDIVSWGTPGTVVASSDVPDDVIYYLVKGVFDDMETFKKQSPMYKNLTREWAVSAGKTIPYHPGAEKYYREVGLIK
jgi:TRAP transporter TAXI family solute receptor